MVFGLGKSLISGGRRLLGMGAGAARGGASAAQVARAARDASRGIGSASRVAGAASSGAVGATARSAASATAKAAKPSLAEQAGAFAGKARDAVSSAGRDPKGAANYAGTQLGNLFQGKGVLGNIVGSTLLGEGANMAHRAATGEDLPIAFRGLAYGGASRALAGGFGRQGLRIGRQMIPAAGLMNYIDQGQKSRYGGASLMDPESIKERLMQIATDEVGNASDATTAAVDAGGSIGDAVKGYAAKSDRVNLDPERLEAAKAYIKQLLEGLATAQS